MIGGAIGPARKSANEVTLDEVMLGIMLLLLCYQNLVVMDFGVFSMKYCHVFFVAFLLYAVARRGRSFSAPPTVINTAFLLLFLLTVINLPKRGFNSVVFNYVFMYALIIAVYNLTISMDAHRLERLIRVVAWIVLASVYVKIAFNVSTIRAFFADSWGGHPSIETFFGGGVNLEASWIALFGVFFHPNRQGRAYIALATVISVLYASRAGLIICIAAVFFVFGVRGKNKGLSFKVFAVAVVMVAAYFALSAIDSPIIERLLSIGEDRGSEGRLRMWRYAWPAFMQSPIIGSGAGSSVSVVGSISGLYYTEGNIHNYYMQVAIDFGIVGFLFLVYALLRFLRKCFANRFDNPFAAYVFAYFVAAFVQFRGGDALTGFMLGCYFSYEFKRIELTCSDDAHIAKETNNAVASSTALWPGKWRVM